jgi:putative Holliday junction resolvase
VSLVTFQALSPLRISNGAVGIFDMPVVSYRPLFSHARKAVLECNDLQAGTKSNVKSSEIVQSHDPSSQEIIGPVLSIDLGSKRVGAAVSDANLIAITRLRVINRSNWKQLLHDVRDLILRFDAKTLVIGFPLSLDGSQGSAATMVMETAKKFALSIELPVYLQDERLTSVEAEERLRVEGLRREAIAAQLDSESAAIILRDFLSPGQQRTLIQR